MQATKNFSRNELQCTCENCKKYDMDHQMDVNAMLSLQRVRNQFGKPIALTSAYRCEKHPVEAKKANAGQHHNGVAVDVRILAGTDRAKLMELFIKEGWLSIGWANSFMHFDRRLNPTTWTYS